jgi:hypothetical protein
MTYGATSMLSGMAGIKSEDLGPLNSRFWIQRSTPQANAGKRRGPNTRTPRLLLTGAVHLSALPLRARSRKPSTSLAPCSQHGSPSASSPRNRISANTEIRFVEDPRTTQANEGGSFGPSPLPTQRRHKGRANGWSITNPSVLWRVRVSALVPVNAKLLINIS